MGYSLNVRFGSLPFYLSDHQTVEAMTIGRFVIYFILFNLTLSVLPLVLQNFYPSVPVLIPRFWNMFAVFGIITFVIYVLAAWRMTVSYKASGEALLASIAVKLLLFMIIAFVYISQNTVDPVKFMVSFFYLYFFHTVFEIYCLLCNLRNQKFK